MVAEKTALDLLAARLNTTWPNIIAARERAETTIASLRSVLARFDSEDVSVVVFGSLARREFTQGSDLDWTLLVDGGVHPDHLDLAARVREAVKGVVGKGPGPEGTFGSLKFSHDLVHLIGGQDDSNRNTTQRILLLLESSPLGRRDAYDRVIASILERYLGEDGFPPSDGRPYVPRFMLNDFARYWRTMAVDFAYKRRDRNAAGAALRRIKLRISRKLIYASGLLVCFTCRLGLCREGCSSPPERHTCIDALRHQMARPPLETLATVLLGLLDRHEEHAELVLAARDIFGAYDRFLAVLADPSRRTHLEELPPEEYATDSAYKEAREVSHQFRDGLMRLFFAKGTELEKLTMAYGVF
jgi:predicted nucleotidyltransferase